MTLMCSNCGEEKTVETILEVTKVIEDGWRTVGDANYCPECSRTWKDRNGREIPSSETGSYWMVLRIYMAEYLEEEKKEKHGT